MYCSHCGQQNAENARFCSSCGKQLTSLTDAPADAAEQSAATAPEAGRGGRILTLGILSIVLLGFVLGIPAWVMGKRDLKKIRAGTIDRKEKGLTQSGMVLGIVGTFVSPLIGVLATILIVAATTLTFRAINHGNTQAGLEALSPAYAAESASLASYDNIEQIRGQTADDIPAVFLLQVSLGYDPTDKEISAEIGNRNREIQDLILKDISQKTAAELSPSHRAEIQAELVHLINTIMKTGKIKSVMFKQFSIVK